MINTEELKAELERLIILSEKIDEALKDAPEGSLYYRYSNKQKRYVPYITLSKKKKRKRYLAGEADAKMVERLAFKTFARHLKHRVEANIAALKLAQKYVPLDTGFKGFGGEGFKAYRQYFFGPESENAEFEALSERQNPYHPEHLNVRTELGVFRSREEYMLARVLYLLGLRFKYETELKTPYGVHYPDFAVLHPKSGKIIYIEYAGKYSDPAYQKSVVTRLRDYMSAGICPGVNLFYISSNADEGFNQAAIMSQLKGIFEL